MFALDSQLKAMQAINSGYFLNECISFDAYDGLHGPITDEFVKLNTTLGSLEELKPVFEAVFILKHYFSYKENIFYFLGEWNCYCW